MFLSTFEKQLDSKRRIRKCCFLLYLLFNKWSDCWAPEECGQMIGEIFFGIYLKQLNLPKL